MILNAYRYTATEIAPNLILSKNLSVGMYYLYSHGWDVGTTTNTHFVTLNSTIANVKVLPETGELYIQGAIAGREAQAGVASAKRDRVVATDEGDHVVGAANVYAIVAACDGYGVIEA